MVGRPVLVGERIVSVLLMVGAVLGLIGSWMLLSGAWRHEQWISMIAPAISVPVFVWAGRQGVDLWRGNPSGRRWATLIFAMQIPIVSVSSLTYEFSMGASARVSFGETSRHFGADIGSSLNLLSAAPQGWMAGVNIVALLVWGYLVFAAAPRTVVSRIVSAR